MSELELERQPGEPQQAVRHRRPRRLRRWVWWMIWIAIACGIAFLAVLVWVAHNAEPILRQRVIANLEQRFQTHVELDELHISVLKGLQVYGSGLRIEQPRTEEAAEEGGTPRAAPSPVDAFNARINAAPLIAVRSFSFRTGIRQLMEPAMRIDSVRVDGVRLQIPPREHEPEKSVDDSGEPKKKKHNFLARLHVPSKSPNSAASHWKIVVGNIVCNDVILTIATDKPGKQPLIFPIRDITFHDVGRGTPMPFEAHLINANPVGEIASTGHFGPWVPEDPRESRIDGSYSFTNANLDPIKGVGGTLSSTGNYGGVLGRIDVTGSTDTPDFSIDTAQHKMPLHTYFNATVDGTTGDTILNSVHATLRHTVLEVQGSVIRANVPTDLARARTSVSQDLTNESLEQAAREQEATGHIIRIAVRSDRARIEDLLTLGVRTMPPLMNGAMTLRAHLTIPPGHVSVAQKIQVEGTFAIRDASFSNAQWQETMNKLSARASGDAEKAKRGDVEDVHPSMRGDFSLASAVLNISNLRFEMPGAAVDVAGKYSLDGNTFDFAGTASTTATASQMLTGWKSLLAKPFDKLLEKNGAGMEVPITISGTRSAPKFGVDRGKLLDQIKGRFHKDSKTDEDQQLNTGPQSGDSGPARPMPQ